jgi:glyoxylase-like metal-dependent hydrolase (beta-lactamase superfamily II)
MTEGQGLRIGEFELFWLDGGSFELDGGAMFGPVPKVIWEKRFPTSTGNNIFMVTNPILIRSPLGNFIIETGLGNKLTEKQAKMFNLRSGWSVPASLEGHGLKTSDITLVFLTHCDYDHAGGLITDKSGELVQTFPNAKIVVQKIEWEDVKKPNRRSIHSFWEINFTGIEESGKLLLVDGEREIVPGITVRHTGGHNRGHQIIKITSRGETAMHLGDLLASHAHYNPLWVMAYDNYPMDVIEQKEKLEAEAIKENAWITFYHDPQIKACKFDEKGNPTEVFK